MKLSMLVSTCVLSTLSGCANLTPPSAEKLASLPIVTYPDTPPGGDYVFKLPAGKPIGLRILVDGTALAANVEQTLGANLNHDLYLHKGWASEDGIAWQRADSLIGVNLAISLPSYETPQSGDIHLTVVRKKGP